MRKYVNNNKCGLTYLLTYLLTYSMKQSPSWEANRFSANQEIPRNLWKLKVHYRIHKSPPPVQQMWPQCTKWHEFPRGFQSAYILRCACNFYRVDWPHNHTITNYLMHPTINHFMQALVKTKNLQMTASAFGQTFSEFSYWWLCVTTCIFKVKTWKSM